MYRLVGWKIYYSDQGRPVMTFRHRCGYEVYVELDEQDNTLDLVRDHVC